MRGERALTLNLLANGVIEEFAELLVAAGPHVIVRVAEFQG